MKCGKGENNFQVILQSVKGFVHVPGWPRTLENRENRENDEKKFPSGKNQGI